MFLLCRIISISIFLPLTMIKRVISTCPSVNVDYFLEQCKVAFVTLSIRSYNNHCNLTIMIVNFHSAAFHSADCSTRLGKTRADLPVEYALARFLQGIENPFPSWNTNITACLWDGIKCNEAQEAISINLIANMLRGELSWIYLPTSVVQLHLYDNIFNGQVTIEHLSRKLERLNGSYNEFSGTLNLTDLPHTIEWLNLCSNNLSGEVALNALPVTLKFFSLSRNAELCGVFRKELLPPQLLKRGKFCVSQTIIQCEPS